MLGLPVDGDLETLARGDRGHHGQGFATAVQVRTLFDMGLEVAHQTIGGVGRPADRSGIQSEVQIGLPQTDPLFVGGVEPRFLEDACHSGRSHHGAAEPSALLIVEGRDLDGEGEGGDQAPAVVDGQQGDCFDGHEDSDDAVVAPGVLD